MTASQRAGEKRPHPGSVKVTLHHSLDARRCIRRRLNRRQAEQREAVRQQEYLDQLNAQLTTLESQQGSLAQRVAAEEAACSALAVRLAHVQAHLAVERAKTATLHAELLARNLPPGTMLPPPEALRSGFFAAASCGLPASGGFVPPKTLPQE